MVLANASLIDQFSRGFEALGATWVLWLLILLSVVSVAIMIERAVYFATHSLSLAQVISVSEQLESGQLEQAVQALDGRRGLEAEVVRAGVRAASLGSEAVEERIRKAVAIERLRYERFLSFLGTLGNNAPFIGLFGTVLGIIEAFAQLAKGAKVGSVSTGASNIMGGISEALVATAVGLLVALPAVAVYNVFARWLKTIAARGEALGHALQSHLKADPSPDEKSPEALPRAAGR
jgi:biopolymer transport protein ExbB